MSGFRWLHCLQISILSLFFVCWIFLHYNREINLKNLDLFNSLKTRYCLWQFRLILLYNMHPCRSGVCPVCVHHPFRVRIRRHTCFWSVDGLWGALSLALLQCYSSITLQEVFRSIAIHHRVVKRLIKLQRNYQINAQFTWHVIRQSSILMRIAMLYQKNPLIVCSI